MNSKVMERPVNKYQNLSPEQRRELWPDGGGYHPNAGRKPGSTNKLSVKGLLAQLSDTVGKPYEQQLAENYRDAIVSQDTKLIHAYDNLFLSKLLADKVSVEVAEDASIVAAKRDAFMTALSTYGQTVLAQSHDNAKLSLEHDAATVAITVEATVTHDTQNSSQAGQDTLGDAE